MEVYSLEDEDCNDLFITQQSPSDKSDKISGEMSANKVLNDPMDFQSPCVSLVGNSQIYSDISDDEFVDIPLSQNARNYRNDCEQ